MTDLDSAYVSTADDNFDEKFVKSLVADEDDGLRRKEELDRYSDGNEFVSVYYAENTFETEVISYDENNSLFVKVMKSNYDKEAYFKKAESDVNSSDLGVRYRRVLKFAKK